MTVVGGLAGRDNEAQLSTVQAPEEHKYRFCLKRKSSDKGERLERC